MTSVPALVNKDVLVWARKSARLDVDAAANKLKVPTERLLAWEAGEEYPTIAKLRELCKAYRRPLAVFFLSSPPRDFQTPRDFRRLPDADEVTADLAAELRHAVERRETALELVEALQLRPPKLDLKASLADDPEKLGKRVRERLGIDVETQKAWGGDSYRALREWRSAIDDAGVLVFRVSIPVRLARGFSIAGDVLPAIAITSKDAPTARVFSLLHELAHVALNKGAICGDDDSQQVEAFCNQVAAAALMPREEFLAEPELEGHGSVWDEAELGVLARRYTVSREAVLRRLLEVGKTTKTFYQRMRATWAARPPPPPNPGFELQPQKAVQSNGALFARIVLGAYSDRVISAVDVTDYLGVRFKHVPEVMRMLRGETPLGDDA